jgi:hypothetical protein
MRANVLSCVVLLMCVLHTTQAATTSLRLVGQVVTGNKTATTEQVENAGANWQQLDLRNNR